MTQYEAVGAVSFADEVHEPTTNRADIFGKEHLYKTARERSTGDFVGLVDNVDGFFLVHNPNRSGRDEWVYFADLFSFCL